MKTFPDIDQDSIAYADELARHIDDPDHLAIFEVLWSGTRQYQRVIEREGLPAIQRLLASVSRNITEAEKRFPELAAIEAKAAAVIAATPEDLKRRLKPYRGRIDALDDKIMALLGKRFAIVARRTGAVTITDYLRARYKSDAVVILCSAALLIFFMAAMLAQFIGGARLFQAVTGYPYIVGLGLFGVTVVLYTSLGGFRAVAFTDAVQGVVMLVAAVLVLLAVMEKGGGMESCIAALERLPALSNRPIKASRCRRRR